MKNSKSGYSHAVKTGKSAYGQAVKTGKVEKHILVIWVDNEAGVLPRVVGLFSGRGYNIESLAVAEIDKKQKLSRITLVTSGSPEVISQIKKQLEKLVPVHKVADFNRNDPKIIFRDMALFKVISQEKKRNKAKKMCSKYDSIVLDKTSKSIVIQVTALRREIDKLVDELKPLGLASVSRTGAVAMTRGAEIFK